MSNATSSVRRAGNRTERVTVQYMLLIYENEAEWEAMSVEQRSASVARHVAFAYEALRGEDCAQSDASDCRHLRAPRRHHTRLRIEQILLLREAR